MLDFDDYDSKSHDFIEYKCRNIPPNEGDETASDISQFPATEPKKDNSMDLPSGEFFLYLFLSKQERESIEGDLREEYREVLSKFGQRKSRIWFYKQVFTSIWPLLRRALLRWSVLGGIGELIHRFLF